MNAFHNNAALGLLLAVSLAGCSAEQPAEDEAAPAAEANVSEESGDALVPGTDYHATSSVACSVDGGDTTAQCDAGVIRNWGEEPGEALVEVTKPDGMKRAIFFRGTEAYGADSAEADGSAGWDFEVMREGDVSKITYGPERYEIVDAFVEGG